MELEHETYLEVPESGKVLSGKMKDVGSVDLKRAGVRSGQRTQDLEQGGLAGAGSTHDGHHLGLVCLEVDAFQDFEVAEALFYPCCLDDHDLFGWSG